MKERAKYDVRCTIEDWYGFTDIKYFPHHASFLGISFVLRSIVLSSLVLLRESYVLKWNMLYF